MSQSEVKGCWMIEFAGDTLDTATKSWVQADYNISTSTAISVVCFCLCSGFHNIVNTVILIAKGGNCYKII